MATIRRFEEIETWNKARELSAAIYRLSGRGDFARDFGLKDQLRRAAVSVMSNIAEGFERDGTKEFLQFLSIAKGSAGEVRSQSYVACDNGYLSESEHRDLHNLVVEVSKMITGFMAYLRDCELRGTKFR